MTTVEEFAPAKVNLTLHIVGRREDGYHLLESLVVFADVGDTVTALPSDALSLVVDGPMARGIPTGEDNLMIKAARLLNPDGQAALKLTKRLPHPAGIGGGSSDAAATLRALCRLWDLPMPSVAQTASLGADVPVCMGSPKPQIMRGIGESVTAAPAIPPCWMVLVHPGFECPTGAVFSRLVSKDNPAMSPIPRFAGFSDFIEWLSHQRNDLQAPAIEAVPVIKDTLIALDQDAALARMSGSGATCFGLYETQKEAETAVNRLQRSGWWVVATPVGSG